MGVIRGRVFLDREIVTRVATVGEIPYRKCECGKWRDKDTGEHVELESLTLKEMMTRYGTRCPDKKEPLK
jgi:hypothetical protein